MSLLLPVVAFNRGLPGSGLDIWDNTVLIRHDLVLIAFSFFVV